MSSTLFNTDSSSVYDISASSISIDNRISAGEEFVLYGVKIDADMVHRLVALLRTIEGLPDNNTLKMHYRTELAMNRIEGSNET